MIHRKLAYSALVLYVLIILPTQSTSKFDIRHDNEMSCFFKVSPESVLPLVSKNFQPSERSIFFHEIDCKSDLTSRQACAVEAAARQNPHWKIYVLLSGVVTNQTISRGRLYTLRKIPNVHLLRILLLDYIKGTPLDHISNMFTRNTYSVPHVSEALPFVTLYKYGGICLGLDTLVIKPLKILEWNFVSLEPCNNFIGSSVVAFSRNMVGRQIAQEVIRLLLKKFLEGAWDVTAPAIITGALKRRCQTNQLTEMNVSRCHGVQVYDSKYLCPVGYKNAHAYFQPGSIEDESVFVHDTWDEVTSHLKIQKNSPYAKLANKNCPEIFTRYYHDFDN